MTRQPRSEEACEIATYDTLCTFDEVLRRRAPSPVTLEENLERAEKLALSYFEFEGMHHQRTAQECDIVAAVGGIIDLQRRTSARSKLPPEVLDHQLPCLCTLTTRGP
jgi:hypothetical protein